MVIFFICYLFFLAVTEISCIGPAVSNNLPKKIKTKKNRFKREKMATQVTVVVEQPISIGIFWKSIFIWQKLNRDVFNR